MIRKYIQPFREGTPAARCELCGEVIYSGDMAYALRGGVWCAECVSSSAFIADTTEYFPDESLYRRTNVSHAAHRKL